MGYRRDFLVSYCLKRMIITAVYRNWEVFYFIIIGYGVVGIGYRVFTLAAYSLRSYLFAI